MKTAIVTRSALGPNLNLSPRHYIESDLDLVTKMVKAQHPGKSVRVTDRHDGTYKVTLTETFIVKSQGERA